MSEPTRTSMAVKAFQMSSQKPENDYWNFLEHIEAPQWVDLSLEATLEGTIGDDPWFYQHHVHHETPLEDLVFGPGKIEVEGRSSKADGKLDQMEASIIESECDPRAELSNVEKNQAWPRSKAKRIELLPDDDCSAGAKVSSTVSPLRPSESFSTKLLSTLMARLRTSEERRASEDGDQEKPLSVSNQNKQSSPSSQTLETVATRKPSQIQTALSRPIQSSKRNKENAQSPRKEKAEAAILKRAKLANSRKSMPALDLTFSTGSGNKLKGPRRSSPINTPPLKVGRTLPSRDRRKSLSSRERRKSIVRISASLLPGAHKAKILKEKAALESKSKQRDDELAALLAKHNSKVRPAPQYEPRLHSTRDIREWERRSGQAYYKLQPLDRVRVNQEISNYKNQQQRNCT